MKVSKDGKFKLAKNEKQVGNFIIKNLLILLNGKVFLEVVEFLVSIGAVNACLVDVHKELLVRRDIGEEPYKACIVV